jgi:hypothetical protein
MTAPLSAASAACACRLARQEPAWPVAGT